MNKVKYTIKDYKDYDSGIYKDFVYFAKDKKKVIVNGVEYGLDVLSDDISILESIEFKDNKLKLKYTNGKEDEIELYDPNKYWDELTVVEEFPKGGCIIKTHPIKEFSFKGEGSGNWYSSDEQEGLYTASDKTITFEEEGEYTLKFVNNYNDGWNGLEKVTDNSVKIVLMIGGSNGVTNGIKPVNKNENAKLILYNNITSIGAGAFSDCTGFTGELILPESLTSIDFSAFERCSGFTGDLIIPDSVTIIGSSAFWYCSGFTGELKLPESLTSIGVGAFYGCKGFTGELKIPENVTSIGLQGFAVCSGFTGELILPETLTSIGDWAFEDCKGLSKIYVCEDTELGEEWNANTTAEVITYKKGETPWIS